jgi:hypothetical protein
MQWRCQFNAVKWPPWKYWEKKSIIISQHSRFNLIRGHAPAESRPDADYWQPVAAAIKSYWKAPSPGKTP